MLLKLLKFITRQLKRAKAKLKSLSLVIPMYNNALFNFK